MKSISCAVMPALSMAILEASTAIVVVVSSVRCAYLLSLMPVRSVIHSSLVSIHFFRSLFVTTFDGTYLPIPAIVERIIQQFSGQFSQYNQLKLFQSELFVFTSLL